MNVLDLGFAYTMDIDFNGDFDDGEYHVSIKYPISSAGSKLAYAVTEVSLKQLDIDSLYDGAKMLVAYLEKHITKSC